MLASASRTSPAVFGFSLGAASGCGRSAALRPCLEPIRLEQYPRKPRSLFGLLKSLEAQNKISDARMGAKRISGRMEECGRDARTRRPIALMPYCPPLPSRESHLAYRSCMLGHDLATSLLRAIEVSDLESRLEALEGTQQSEERAILQVSPPDSKQEGGV